MLLLVSWYCYEHVVSIAIIINSIYDYYYDYHYMSGIRACERRCVFDSGHNNNTTTTTTINNNNNNNHNNNVKSYKL